MIYEILAILIAIAVTWYITHTIENDKCSKRINEVREKMSKEVEQALKGSDDNKKKVIRPKKVRTTKK